MEKQVTQEQANIVLEAMGDFNRKQEVLNSARNKVESLLALLDTIYNSKLASGEEVITNNLSIEKAPS